MLKLPGWGPFRKAKLHQQRKLLQDQAIKASQQTVNAVNSLNVSGMRADFRQAIQNVNDDLKLSYQNKFDGIAEATVNALDEFQRLYGSLEGDPSIKWLTDRRYRELTIIYRQLASRIRTQSNSYIELIEHVARLSPLT